LTTFLFDYFYNSLHAFRMILIEVLWLIVRHTWKGGAAGHERNFSPRIPLNVGKTSNN